METYITPCTGDAPYMVAPAYNNLIQSLKDQIASVPEVIEDQATAITATSVIARVNGFIKEAEAEHKKLKAPYLERSRILDGIKKDIVNTLSAFKDTLNNRIVAYQRAEQEKARKAAEEAAAKAAEIAAQAAAEREKLAPEMQTAHAAATDIVAQQAAANIIAAAAAAPVAGTRISRRVEIKSVNIVTLAAARIDLCKIEADLPKIKAEILAGKTVPGVDACVVETASVRAASANINDFDF